MQSGQILKIDRPFPHRLVDSYDLFTAESATEFSRVNVSPHTLVNFGYV